MEKKKNKTLESDKYMKWLLFISVFLLSIIYSIIINEKAFQWDSAYYWSIGDSIWEKGFHIIDYPETFRGYFLPTTIQIFKKIFKGAWGWRILIALMFSICNAFLLPKLFKNTSVKSAKEVVRSLISVFIFLAIWGHFLQFPLSDFPAIFFSVTGIVFLMNNIDEKRRIKIFVNGIFAGFFFYASYNTRAVFLYGIIWALLVYFWKCHISISKIMISLLAVMLGASIVAFPQCIINEKYTNQFSPKIFTEQVYNYSRNLQSVQLFGGLEHPRYETYVGDYEKYPEAAVVFDDPIGKEILQREGVTVENFSIKELLKLIWKYPLDICGIYTRHLVSILTPAYSTVYVKNLYTNKGIITVVSILIWVTALIGLSNCLAHEKYNNNVWWIVALMIPALMQMAGAVEIRFFLPIYLMGYYYVFSVIDYKELWLEIKNEWKRYIIYIIALVFLWIAIYGDTLSYNVEKTFLINDNEKTIEQSK